MSKVTRQKPNYKKFGPGVVGEDGYMYIPLWYKEKSFKNHCLKERIKRRINQTY